MNSEAYLSLLEFYAHPPPSFDPDHAQSRRYASTIASRHMSNWCFAQSSPVSAAPRAQRCGNLAGLRRVSTSDVGSTFIHGIGRRRAYFDASDGYGVNTERDFSSVDNRVVGDMEAEIIALEAASLVPRLHAQLRERLNEIYEVMYPDESLDVAEACIDVLAENAKSKDAATDHCVSLRDVYRRTERLKTRACHDDMVRELLTQIQDHRGDLHAYA